MSQVVQQSNNVDNNLYYPFFKKIKNSQYKTTVPEKLYAALRRHVDTNQDYDVAAVMDGWTTQSGYPVVTVQVQDNRTDINISQKRFLLKNMNHNDATKWDIPLNYATSKGEFQNTTTQFWLRKNNGEVTVQLNNKTEWIVFNVQQTGFYRVNYDEGSWKRIAKALKQNDTEIDVINRAQVKFSLDFLANELWF